VTALAGVGVEGPLFRVGRGPDPWEWPDWAFAGEDGTFGNRYDDPEAEYRVLYASSDDVAPFVETLARFRPDVTLLAELDQIAGEGDDPPTLRGGIVPLDWLTTRSLGTALVGGQFCDVGNVATLTHLRSALASLLAEHELGDLDAGDIRSRAPRAFTQALGRHVYEAGEEQGGPFVGVRYRSRLADDLVNWAVFEGADVTRTGAEQIEAKHAGLLQALQLLGLELEGHRHGVA
jgi:RES domain